MAVADPSAQLASFWQQNPYTRFIDVLLADFCGIPRGKRVTLDELPGIHRASFLLPGSMFALDVLGATIQETGLGFDEGDADHRCLPSTARWCQCPGAAKASRKCRSR